MKHLARVLVLIGLVAGGPSARAALERPGHRAHVVLTATTQQQCQSLCQALAKLSCRVQVSQAGKTVRIEIAANSRAALASALSALAKAAQDAGVPVEPRIDDAASAGIDAIACRGIAISKHLPPGQPCPQFLPEDRNFFDLPGTPALWHVCLAWPLETSSACPISLRGPPACA